MSAALSPASLNSAWMQGMIDAVYLNPFRDPLKSSPYPADSDLSEMWHYGAQYAMAREGVTIEGFDNDTGEMPTVDEAVMKAMTEMKQAKGPQL